MTPVGAQLDPEFDLQFSILTEAPSRADSEDPIKHAMTLAGFAMELLLDRSTLGPIIKSQGHYVVTARIAHLRTAGGR